MTAGDGNEWGGYIDQPDDDPVVQPTQPAQPTEPTEPFEPTQKTQPKQPAPPPAAPPPKRSGGGPAWMRGPWRYVIAVVGIAAIAVGVIEIVSSGKKNTTTTSTPAGTISKAAFIQRADAICAKFNPMVANDYHTYELDYESGNTSGAGTAALAFEHDAQTELDELRVIPPPSQGASTVSQLLSDDAQEIQDYESGPPNSEGAQEAVTIGQQTDGIATSYGFRVCGQS